MADDDDDVSKVKSTYRYWPFKFLNVLPSSAYSDPFA